MKKNFIFFVLLLIVLIGVFLILDSDDNISTGELESKTIKGVIEKVNISGCGALSTTGGVYILTEDIASTGTCFTVSATNVVLDCQGHAINYSQGGAANTYGVISNQFNTTIKNCSILDGNRMSSANSRYGVYFNGADNGTIQNTTVNTSNSAGIRVYSDANNNLFDNVNFISNSGEGMRFYESKNNVIFNSTIISGTNFGIYMFGASTGNIVNYSSVSSISNIGITIVSPSGNNNILNSAIFSNTFIAMRLASNNNLIYNSNGTVISSNGGGSSGISVEGNGNKLINFIGNATNGGRGIYLKSSNYTEITNSHGYSGTSYGIYFYTNTNDVTVSDSYFYSGVTGSVLRFEGGSNSFFSGNIFVSGATTNPVIYFDRAVDNTFVGNTFVSSTESATLLQLTSSSSNNVFYYNNFTQTSGDFVNNANGANQFNTTVEGVSRGNYYFNIESVNIEDSNSDGWGDEGIDYPLSSSTWASMWAGYGADWGPATSIVVEEDLDSPTYDEVFVNNTFAGQITNFAIRISDNRGLHSSGQYIFSTNNTGEWINDSAINFTSTPSWVNVTKILNTNVGSLVSYIWYFTDNAGNMGNSGERSFVIEEYVSCTDTCSSLGYTCGIQTICGESVTCGGCSEGYTCQIGGSCVLDTCVSHSYSGCYNGDVYWYDSCNGVEEIINDCDSAQICTNGACVNTQSTGAIIIDHTTTNLSKIPDYWLEEAKKLTIQYAHRSDGGNIFEGLGYLYRENDTLRYTRLTDALPVQTNPIGMRIMDGNPPLSSYSYPELYWSTEEGRNATLNNWKTGNFNASMWSWCNELDVLTYPLPQVQEYLDTMNSMEANKTGNYSDLDFIYMTGYTDNTNSANVANNQLIRDYAIANGKILYDFEDIGKYDPDGVYYADANRECTWCASWCEENPTECLNLPSCSHVSAEDGGLVCVQRGKAFWWMMARLAGWDGVTGDSVNDTVAPTIIINSPLNQTYTSGEIVFNITATDSSNVSSCSYSLDSEENILLENTLGDYWSSMNNLSSGAYDVTFYCNDSLGNINSVSESFIFNGKISSQVSLTYIITPNCSVIEGEGVPVLRVNGEVAVLGQSYDISTGNYTFNCSVAESDNYSYSETVSTVLITLFGLI